MRISDWSSDVCSSDLALGRLPAAEREYQAALEVAPDNAWTLNNLAWLRMSLGKAEEAVRPARKAAEIAPGAPEIADTLGMILLEVGDKREALDLLRKARQGAADKDRKSTRLSSSH